MHFIIIFTFISLCFYYFIFIWAQRPIFLAILEAQFKAHLEVSFVVLRPKINPFAAAGHAQAQIAQPNSASSRETHRSKAQTGLRISQPINPVRMALSCKPHGHLLASCVSTPGPMHGLFLHKGNQRVVHCMERRHIGHAYVAPARAFFSSVMAEPYGHLQDPSVPSTFTP